MIIELVGPAGAGKTSLAGLLKENNKVTVISHPPYYRNLIYLPFFIKNSLRLIPTFFQLGNLSHSNWPSLEPLYWIMTLQGWHAELLHKASQHNPVIVLDEGPIYYMAYLRVYGPQVFKTPQAHKWWESIYKRWSKTLDTVIWMDSSNQRLIDRIRAREDWHGVKIKTDLEAYKFLDDLREAYEAVIPRLQAKKHRVKILRFDAGEQTLDQIREQVVAELGLMAA